MAKAEKELLTDSTAARSRSRIRSKVLFPEAGYTKLDLVNYYLAVAEGALRGAGGRPNVLVRYPNGLGEEFFYQKRAPDSRPDWIEVVALKFPSGRTAEEVVPRDAAALAWMANLACLELHPHPVRAEELDHPDELRVDLDPVPGVEWRQVQDVAKVVRATLDDLGLIGWPKTSGSRGIHVNVRIHQRWTFIEVRRAAVALAREVERRAPAIATSKWWKEERHGVFIDYNQNAKDRDRVLGVFGAPASRRARLDAAHLGRDRCVRSRRLHDEDHAGVVQGERRSPCRDRPSPVLAREAPRTVREAGEGRAGRRALAAAIQEDARRADARSAVAGQEGPKPQVPSPRPKTGRRVSKHPLIVIAHSTKKEEALAALERVEGRKSGGRRASSARRHPDRFDARPIVELVAHPHQPAARARELRPEQPELPPIPNPWANATPEQIAAYREMHRKRRQARKPE